MQISMFFTNKNFFLLLFFILSIGKMEIVNGMKRYMHGMHKRYRSNLLPASISTSRTNIMKLIGEKHAVLTTQNKKITEGIGIITKDISDIKKTFTPEPRTWLQFGWDIASSTGVFILSSVALPIALQVVLGRLGIQMQDEDEGPGPEQPQVTPEEREEHRKQEALKNEQKIKRNEQALRENEILLTRARREETEKEIDSIKNSIKDLPAQMQGALQKKLSDALEKRIDALKN